MPTGTIRSTTRNQVTVDYEYEVTFLYENRYLNNQAVLNNTGATITLVNGTVLGRIAATNKLVPLDPAGADGSQYPVGVYKGGDLELADAAEDVCTICIAGSVNENKLDFVVATTLDAVIELKTVRDRIAADTAGIILVLSDELSNYDN
jgi:hypothetical protein